MLWQDFTSSTARLRNALAQLHAIPFRGLPAEGQVMPGTLLYDAVYQTAIGKLKGVPGRKTMLIVSDGLDNGSRMHLEEALQAVQATNTIVYGICYDQKFFGCDISQEPGRAHRRPDVRRGQEEKIARRDLTRPSKTSCAANTRSVLRP